MSKQSSQLGVLEIECDAPAYAIVRACRKLGMSKPEDVRWRNTGRRTRRRPGWMHFLYGPFWDRLLGRTQSDAARCVCGQPLPDLEAYSFTFQSGEQVDYEMGQCSRCRTIYWGKL